MNARSEIENLLLILNGWKDSSSLIKLKFDKSFSLEIWVYVKEALPTRVTLAVFGENVAKVGFDPRGCTFRYADPREADESIKRDVESKVVCSLSVLLPDGINFLLYEPKSKSG